MHEFVLLQQDKYKTLNLDEQCKMNYVFQPCPESVPYKLAIHNRKTLLSSTESRESLAQQVGFNKLILISYFTRGGGGGNLIFYSRGRAVS